MFFEAEYVDATERPRRVFFNIHQIIAIHAPNPDTEFYWVVTTEDIYKITVETAKELIEYVRIN